MDSSASRAVAAGSAYLSACAFPITGEDLKKYRADIARNRLALPNVNASKLT